VTPWGVLASPEVWEVVKASWDDEITPVGWVSFSPSETASLLAEGGIDYILVEARGDLLTADLVAVADGHDIAVVALITGIGGDEVANRVGVAARVRQPDDLARLVQAPRVASSDSGTLAHPGLVIAVWGPTGSPGRTFTASAIAHALSRRSVTTLLIDADSRSGAVAPSLGLLDEVPGFIACLRLADRGSVTVADLRRLAHRYDVSGTHFDVLTGVTSSRIHQEVTPDNIRDVVAACSGVWEAVVVETGSEKESHNLATTPDTVVASTLLGMADEAVALCQATPVGVARFSRVYGDATDLRARRPMTAVLNGVEASRRTLNDEATLREALRRFADVTHLHVIPRDVTAARQAEMTGVSLGDADPKSPAVKAINHLVGPWVQQVEARSRRGSVPADKKNTRPTRAAKPASEGLWARVRILWDRIIALR
jgi:cellulose biosynthesis protein BcsQ